MHLLYICTEFHLHHAVTLASSLASIFKRKDYAHVVRNILKGHSVCYEPNYGGSSWSAPASYTTFEGYMIQYRSRHLKNIGINGINQT